MATLQLTDVEVLLDGLPEGDRPQLAVAPLLHHATEDTSTLRVGSLTASGSAKGNWLGC